MQKLAKKHSGDASVTVSISKNDSLCYLSVDYWMFEVLSKPVASTAHNSNTWFIDALKQ